jgi:hypothetical protein
MLKNFLYKIKSIKNEYYKKYKFNTNIYHSSFSREWYNTIYSYNKNTIKLLSITDKFVLKLIKNYFNLYSNELERKVKLYKLRRWMRRLSIKRILISKIGLKHTNDKIIITIYIFNKQKVYFLNKIKKFLKNNISFSKIKVLKKKFLDILHKIINKKNIVLNTYKWDINNLKEYEYKYYKKFIDKSLKYMKLYVYYKQLLSFNKLKLNNSYIFPLKIFLEGIYNKKVEFNLISLKYYYLNPYIYLQVLTTKLRNRNNRIYKVLNKSLREIKLPSSNELILFSNKERINNLPINKLRFNPLYFSTNKINEINDSLDNYLFHYYKLNLNIPNNYENIILNSIKYKIFSGIRVEATGRLSKRLIAARTIFKHRYVGNLKDLNFSYKGTTSSVFRGNIRSNIYYAKQGSKTKIGSYGLKSWINNT